MPDSSTMRERRVSAKSWGPLAGWSMEQINRSFGPDAPHGFFLCHMQATSDPLYGCAAADPAAWARLQRAVDDGPTDWQDVEAAAQDWMNEREKCAAFAHGLAAELVRYLASAAERGTLGEDEEDGYF